MRCIFSVPKITKYLLKIHFNIIHSFTSMFIFLKISYFACFNNQIILQATCPVVTYQGIAVFAN